MLCINALKPKCGKFYRGDEGTTAVEFSMLLVPYIMVVLAILEVSLMYLSASLLEGSTTNAARMIKTGQIQQSGSVDPAGDFRNVLCSQAAIIIACDDIEIEAQTMVSYDDFDTLQPQFDDDGNMVSQGFAVGGSNDRILIRASFRYEMMTPLIGPLLGGPDSSHVFISTLVLQTEPYEFEDGA